MYNKSQPRTGHTREPDPNVRKGEFRKVVLRVLRAGSQLARVGKADEVPLSSLRQVRAKHQVASRRARLGFASLATFAACHTQYEEVHVLQRRHIQVSLLCKRAVGAPARRDCPLAGRALPRSVEEG